MTYNVLLQPLAQADLEEAFLRAAGHAPDTATLWLSRFHAALQTLSEQPTRCGSAVESKKLRRDLRQLLFGAKPNVFRAIFLIDGSTVRILRICRASRRSLTRKELGSP
jgi:plasmid stabilization system protein ParE